MCYLNFYEQGVDWTLLATNGLMYTFDGAKNGKSIPEGVWEKLVLFNL
jgi:hypothetical protein